MFGRWLRLTRRGPNLLHTATLGPHEGLTSSAADALMRRREPGGGARPAYLRPMIHESAGDRHNDHHQNHPI